MKSTNMANFQTLPPPPPLIIIWLFSCLARDWVLFEFLLLLPVVEPAWRAGELY